MTSSAPPLAVPAAAPARAGAVPAERAPSAPPRRRRSRDVLPWALAGSVLLHLVLLLLSPLVLRLGPPPGEVEGERALARPELRALEIAQARALTPEAPPPAASAPPRERVLVPVPGPATGQPLPGEARSAPPAESPPPGLRPGPRDPRLWIAPRELPPPPELSEHEVYMERLRARLDAVNDSMGMGAPNTDWTTTDAAGRRWGLSPAGVHLGGITIPRELLPIPMTSSEREAEVRERQRQREEIQRDEAERERRRILRERERVPRRESGGG
jgi:hypothetical protein